jgi:hypothetical protein
MSELKTFHFLEPLRPLSIHTHSCIGVHCQLRVPDIGTAEWCDVHLQLLHPRPPLFNISYF